MKEKKIFDIRIELTPVELAIAVILILAFVGFLFGLAFEAVSS
jgi:hypothetical protein